MSAPRRTPMTFLSLGPVTSDSFPKVQPAQTATAAPTTESTAEMHKRRSSSLSSAGGGMRILKLGPVHYGEHPGDCKSDFHQEVAVSEE